MSKVTVNLFAGLRTFIDGAPSTDVEFDSDMTAEDAIAKLGIPVEKARIIFVNNRAVDLEDKISDGDKLDIFPAIGGG